jgi:hypothetical protein
VRSSVVTLMETMAELGTATSALRKAIEQIKSTTYLPQQPDMFEQAKLLPPSDWTKYWAAENEVKRAIKALNKVTKGLTPLAVTTIKVDNEVAQQRNPWGDNVSGEEIMEQLIHLVEKVELRAEKCAVLLGRRNKLKLYVVPKE